MNIAFSEQRLPARVRFEPPLTDDELLRFCADNDPVRVEQEPNGDLLLMSPTGTDGAGPESDAAADLIVWAREDGRGRAYSSNAGFRLKDGSMRAADAAWVSWTRLRELSHEQRKSYAPLCPEFVIEVRSESDRLSPLRAKMQEWLANGAELAWLIDPERKMVEIYRPGREPEAQEGHSAVYGEGPVGGFVLELGRIWG